MDCNAKRYQTAPKMSTNATPTLSFDALQALDESGFVARLGGVVELSPWVVQRAWQRRPFASREAVFEALAGCIRSAPLDEQLALLRAHPELAGREAVAGTMTPESNAEQGRLGLLALSHDDWERLNALNTRYRERFGFPFLVALRLHDSLTSVFDSFERRLNNDPPQERDEALGQVCEVMRGRLERILAEAGAPA